MHIKTKTKKIREKKGLEVVNKTILDRDLLVGCSFQEGPM
jgi:hypothetical protein